VERISPIPTPRPDTAVTRKTTMRTRPSTLHVVSRTAPIASLPRSTRRSRLVALPGCAAEPLAARRCRVLVLDELAHARGHRDADFVGESARGGVEARHEGRALPGARCLCPVEVEPAVLVPHQGLLARIDAVAELELHQLSGPGLPYEQIEIVVVEPAPVHARLVGNT